MKRSSQPKALDVPAETVSPNNPDVDVEVLPKPTRPRTKAAMKDESAFGDSYDEEVDDAFDEDADGSAMIDDLEDELDDTLFDQEEFWTEELDDHWEEDAISPTEHYYDEEFDLDEEDELEVARSLGDAAPQSRLQSVLERGVEKALAASNSREFLTRLLQVLNQATALLRTKEPVRSRSRNRRNGHHPNLQQQVLSQSLASRLRELTLLTRCYGKRGLSEFDLLEDAIPLLNEPDGKTLTPILAGLATRISLLPRLEGTERCLKPPLVSQLLRAAQKSIALLTRADSIQALPGLALTLGQRTQKAGYSLQSLPSEFYQTARKVAHSPRLQQRLSQIKPEQPASVLVNGDEMPLKLRVNAPIEIVFRQPGGQ